MLHRDRFIASTKKMFSGAWKDYKVGILLNMNENILIDGY